MTEFSRPVGRPPKVRPAAAPALTEQEVQAAISATFDVPAAPEPAPAPAADRMVEVEILHKYAPGGQKTEIMKVVYPGTVMELPVLEATRALKLGIARATDRTFG